MHLLSIALVLALMCGTRLLLGSAIPGFHEYESFFIYASDVVVLLYIGWVWSRAKQEASQLFHKHGGVFFSLMLVGGLAALITAVSPSLAFYSLLRLSILVCLAYFIGVVARPEGVLRSLLVALAVAGCLQALLGVAQFAHQGSVGLTMLGEPVLESASPAASTIIAEGGRVLRAYGTFPHPNVLGAFLAITLAILWHYYISAEKRIRADVFKTAGSWKNLAREKGNLRVYAQVLNQYLTHRFFLVRVCIVAGVFLSTLGLTLTFSRSAWIAAFTALVVYTVWQFFSGESKGALLRLWLLNIVCCIVVGGLLGAVIAPRAQLRSGEPAVAERLSYARLGLRIAAEQFAGVGPGNQVLYAVQSGEYKAHGFLKVWHWEPVHMIYLLVLVEYGWLGLLSFVGFLGMVSWRLIRMRPSGEVALVGSLFAAILVLGFFDHLLWDIQQGRMLFWLVIGLVLSRLPFSSPSRKQ